MSKFQMGGPTAKHSKPRMRERGRAAYELHSADAGYAMARDPFR